MDYSREISKDSFISPSFSSNLGALSSGELHSSHSSISLLIFIIFGFIAKLAFVEIIANVDKVDVLFRFLAGLFSAAGIFLVLRIV